MFYRKLMLGTAALLLVCGCAAPNRFAEPIGKLDQATNITLQVTKERFNRAASLTRERAYLVAWKNKVSVRGDFINEKSADFTLPFSTEALRARTELIGELQTFCRLLTKVAGSDVDKQFGVAIQATAKNLSTISTQLGESADLAQSVKLLGDVVATIGSAIIEGKREEAIRTALTDAAPHIEKMASLLSKDLETLHIQTRTSLNTLVPMLANAADATVNNEPDSNRLALINQLSLYNKERLELDSVQEANAKALKELEITFGKLEKFQPENDFSEYIPQIETFLSTSFSLYGLWSK